MVLKNSNSRLNSGATQRVTNGGTLKWSKFDWNPEKIIHLEVNFKNGMKKQTDHLAEYLQKIWGRWGWNGPDVFLTFRDKLNTSPGPRMWAELGWYSTNKRKTWLLPQRILSMMADTDFLKDILPQLDISVSEHRRIPETGRGTRIIAKTHLSSKIVSEACTLTAEKCKESRRRQTFHNRGIQRPRLFRHQPKPEEIIESILAEPSPVLNVDIYHPYHVDARCANKNDVNRFTKRLYCAKKTKSRLKFKGHVNGRYAELKGYTRDEIMEETQMTLLGQNYLCDEDWYHSPKFYDGHCCSNYHHYNHGKTHFTSVSLCDFVVQHKTKIKRGKKRKHQQELKSDMKDFVKYPKGSFKLIPREVNLSESSSESTWEILDQENLEDSFTLVKTDNREHMDNGYASYTEKDEIVQSTPENKQLLKKVDLFDQSFIDVTLALLVQDVNGIKTQEINIDGRKLMIGKCSPPAFVVDLGHSDKICEKCFLVGKKIDMNSSSWLVSFQCMNYNDANIKLQNALFEEWTCCLKLSRLIELAIIVKNEAHSCSHPEACEDSLVSSPDCQINPSSTVIFGPPEKVVSYLPAQNENKASDSVNTIAHEETTDTQLNECPVCLLPFHDQKCPAMKLLPCGHTFCVKCWQTQIISGMQQGANQCACLAVKCQNVVDQTTMLTLLPLDIVSSWQRHTLERSIEASQYCNWCPRDRCQNIAVSLTTPLKTQFGQALTCTCGHSWCGSCKDAPHWPASCDQMTAYKKLISKVGLNKDMAYDTTNYYVRLKPCPHCKYPIEKNNGCPSMVCRMCNYNFCWNCLKNASFHTVYTCPPNDDNYVTFVLQNKLVHDLPLKYFTECIKVRRQIQTLTIEGRKWLQYLKNPLPSDRLIKVKSFTNRFQVDVALVVDEVDKCLDFVVRYYTFQEMLYLLLDFAQMHDSRHTKQYLGQIAGQCSQLQFVAERLQENILGQPAHHIYNRRKLSKQLISAGERVMSGLMQLVPYIQHKSKDVDAKPIGEIDPLQHLRYK